MSLTDPSIRPIALRRQRTSAISRALEVFDHLQATQQALTAYEIARSIGAPLSTVYAIVDDLVAKDLLTRDMQGFVWFGPRLYYYGLTYARSLDLLTEATHQMHELARRSGETVQVCGRDQDDMVVLAMEEGDDHFQVTSRVGTRTPLSWTASGRLLVGHLPEAELIDLFRRSARPSPTERAETDPEALSRRAREALKLGFSIQAGESDFAVACIAAPIRDRTGACRATMSIVVSERRAEQKGPELIQFVLASAKQVEKRLGWQH